MFCPNPDCPDLEASGVRGEYREGITHCPTCGTALVDGVASESAQVLQLVDGDVEVETVFVTADGTEAAVVRSLLDSSDIPYIVDGAAGQDYLGLGLAGVGVIGRGGVAFKVRTEDVEAARALLAESELPAEDYDEPPAGS
jgi:hypothetical protein